ncbi:MAG: VOC family protein [Pyrinomonadaceae bacterium]|nr:VOC family protein [Pyrinomonadaceae bacterium]
MSSFNPYLNFPGTTEEAFNFYRSAFGGEFERVMRFGEMPGCDESPISEADKSKIMHIALPIGNGTMLMGTDSLESMGQKLTMGNNYYISISPESKEEADRLFTSLSDGGTVEMPMADTFWGSYFGCFADKYGVRWMIDHATTPEAA